MTSHSLLQILTSGSSRWFVAGASWHESSNSAFKFLNKLTTNSYAENHETLHVHILSAFLLPSMPSEECRGLLRFVIIQMYLQNMSDLFLGHITSWRSSVHLYEEDEHNPVKSKVAQNGDFFKAKVITLSPSQQTLQLKLATTFIQLPSRASKIVPNTTLIEPSSIRKNNNNNKCNHLQLNANLTV